MKWVSVLFLALLLIHIGIPNHAVADGFLTKKELKLFYAGRTIDLRGRDGVSMTQTFKPDGRLETFFDRPGNPHTHETRWWVTDFNTICFVNAKDRQFCHKIKRVGDGYERYNPRGKKMRGYWKPRL